MTHLRRVPLQELPARRLAAARGQTTGTRPAGAGPPLLPHRSLEGVTERLTQPVVCNHTILGTPQEAAVRIRGEEKPEAVASRLNVVAETTEVGSRAAAGAGPGAAGNQAAPFGGHVELSPSVNLHHFSCAYSPILMSICRQF